MILLVKNIWILFEVLKLLKYMKYKYNTKNTLKH